MVWVCYKTVWIIILWDITLIKFRYIGEGTVILNKHINGLILDIPLRMAPENDGKAEGSPSLAYLEMSRVKLSQTMISLCLLISHCSLIKLVIAHYRKGTSFLLYVIEKRWIVVRIPLVLMIYFSTARWR